MRRTHDLYFTNTKAVKDLTERVKIEGQILEPCNGGGNITTALINILNIHPFTNDILNGLDATKNELWEKYNNVNWIITNPPFTVAYKILEQAVGRYYKVAFLLRLSFLEPTYERQELLVRHPPDKLIVLPRYSFTEDGKTDSVTCAWMIWNYKDDKAIEIVKK